jgi:hypothetical protein
MTKLISMKAPLSRRQVMTGALGLSFAFALDGSLARAATLVSERAGKTLSPWVSISPDGTITIVGGGRDGAGLMTRCR